MALMAVWIPISVCAMTVILAPGRIERFWNAQNINDEENDYDLFI
jgi:hypothetical protein